jgi:hypothetical protein
VENLPSSILPRWLPCLVWQSGEPTNEGQRTLEVEERGALAALQVLDAAAPARTVN